MNIIRQDPIVTIINVIVGVTKWFLSVMAHRKIIFNLTTIYLTLPMITFIYPAYAILSNVALVCPILIEECDRSGSSRNLLKVTDLELLKLLCGLHI